MIILLIYTDSEQKRVDKVLPLLTEKNAHVKALPVSSRGGPEANIRMQFASFFEPPESGEKSDVHANTFTHAIILSSLPERWIDFLAGFSHGSRLPFLVYGEKAIESIPVEFASCFRFIRSESSLAAYLGAENEASEKWELAQGIVKARETLLQMGIPVNGESLALYAGEGSIREVALFLAAGFSPDTRNKAGVPLLCISARKGNGTILRLLIQAGADPNLCADDRGTSALLDCVMSRHYELAPDLIKVGADVNIKSKDGQSALIVAVGNGDEGIVEALLRAGAEPDAPDSLGTSARKYAALFHKSSIVALFDSLTPLPALPPADG